MRLKDVRGGFAVVVKKYYDRYGNNAFVDRVCDSLEEAEYVKDSLQRCDGMSFVIINRNHDNDN